MPQNALISRESQSVDFFSLCVIIFRNHCRHYCRSPVPHLLAHNDFSFTILYFCLCNKKIILIQPLPQMKIFTIFYNSQHSKMQLCDENATHFHAPVVVNFVNKDKCELWTKRCWALQGLNRGALFLPSYLYLKFLQLLPVSSRLPVSSLSLLPRLIDSPVAFVTAHVILLKLCALEVASQM